MFLRWLVPGGACLLLGAGFAFLLPREWGDSRLYGPLFGGALFHVAVVRAAVRARDRAGGVRHRWIGPAGILPAVILRSAVFLGILALFLFSVYDWLRAYDMRWQLVAVAAMALSEDLLDRGRRATAR
jgi:hypothetical protein